MTECMSCGGTGWVIIEDCLGVCNEDGTPCMTNCDECNEGSWI